MDERSLNDRAPREVYPETRESIIMQDAYDAVLRHAELMSKLEAECQELRRQVVELERACKMALDALSGDPVNRFLAGGYLTPDEESARELLKQVLRR